MKKIYLLALVVLGFSANSFAQTNLTTTNAATVAKATTITPISIANTVALNFGDIAVNGTSGTVVLPASATPSMSATGGVQLPSGSSGTAADFSIEGLDGAAYTITIPDEIILTKVAGVTMKVVPTCSIDVASGLLSGGKETFYVGGTLTVAGSRQPGDYSGTFNVSVIYN